MKPEDKAVVQQALEALEVVWCEHKAIDGLRQLLEQPEEDCPHGADSACKECHEAAQPAAWVELTDEDYPDADNPYCCVNSDFIEGARWASAKLREKNGGGA